MIPLVTTCSYVHIDIVSWLHVGNTPPATNLVGQLHVDAGDMQFIVDSFDELSASDAVAKVCKAVRDNRQPGAAPKGVIIRILSQKPFHEFVELVQRVPDKRIL
jgi:hypothetical protein